MWWTLFVNGLASARYQRIRVASGIDLFPGAINALEILFDHDPQRPTSGKFLVVLQANFFVTSGPGSCIDRRDSQHEFAILKPHCVRRRATENLQAIPQDSKPREPNCLYNLSRVRKLRYLSSIES